MSNGIICRLSVLNLFIRIRMKPSFNIFKVKKWNANRWTSWIHNILRSNQWNAEILFSHFLSNSQRISDDNGRKNIVPFVTNSREVNHWINLTHSMCFIPPLFACHFLLPIELIELTFFAFSLHASALNTHFLRTIALISIVDGFTSEIFPLNSRQSERMEISIQ